MARPIVYRFTRDLRLDDHAGLADAAAHGDVVPVLVIDRALENRIGRSPRRAAFFCATVAALDASLRERGSRLLVRRGPAGTALKSIARACNASGVTWSRSYDAASMQSDERLQSELEEAGLRAGIVHDAPAIPPEETAAARSDGRGYRAFAPYFDVWKTLKVASYEAPLLMRFASTDLQSEALPSPHDFNALERITEAGERAALDRLRRFLGETAMQYSIAMNVPSDGGTSHLSAHLSFGAISARRIIRDTLERLDDPFLLSEERVSIRAFLRSIAMRDFFLQLGWFEPQTESEPLQEKMHGFHFASTHPALEAWKAGKTGFPLVDAGIRQLHETGWMHPHVRAVAASFLCFDLGVDWRVGCDEWERRLIEDDPALSIGNWQWVAGVGADMVQYPRIYNPQRQRRRFDPGGAYVKRWVPELAHVPVGSWQSIRGAETQLALPLFARDGYPQPVVDHEEAAREFLKRYRAFLER